MNPQEIKEIVKTILEETAEYGKLVYVNINFNFQGSTSNVHLSGKPTSPPTDPPGGGK